MFTMFSPFIDSFLIVVWALLSQKGKQLIWLGQNNKRKTVNQGSSTGQRKHISTRKTPLIVTVKKRRLLTGRKGSSLGQLHKKKEVHQDSSTRKRKFSLRQLSMKKAAYQGVSKRKRQLIRKAQQGEGSKW
jgi:hypothetical protein